MVDDNFYMNLALQEAWKYQGLTYPNPAVGALIVDKNGKILSVSAHKKHGTPHAELNAVKEAYLTLKNDTVLQNITNPSQIHSYLLKNHSDLFKNCKIYVTLEPCNHFGSTPPCSLLLSSLGFGEVIIGSIEENPEAAGGINRLKQNGINVRYNVLKEKCDSLLYPFKQWKKDRFVFFKIATNLNGTYDTGIISSLGSRKYVHALRDKTDLLIIGGNTVRSDRPTLDSRLVGGKAPDILIYSKQKEFDKSIPLFSVENRKVFISDNFEMIEDYNYIMIEGGDNMLEATKKITNWYLFFIAPVIKKGNSLNSPISFKPLYSTMIENDTVQWFGT